MLYTEYKDKNGDIYRVIESMPGFNKVEIYLKCIDIFGNDYWKFTKFVSPELISESLSRADIILNSRIG